MRLSLRILLPLLGLLLACRAEELVTPPAEEEPPVLRGTVRAADGEPASGVKINLIYELVGYPKRSACLDEAPAPLDTLLQNYPNPFELQTTLRFSLAVDQTIHLLILDEDGNTRRTLIQGYMPAGEHSVIWNGRDDDGAVLPNAVYRIRLVFHAEVDGPSAEIDRVFSLSRDAAVLAESALLLTDDDGRFSIPLSELPVDRMIPVTSVDGVLQGIFPVSSILQVHAGRTDLVWDRVTLDLGDGTEDVDVELQLP